MLTQTIPATLGDDVIEIWVGSAGSAHAVEINGDSVEVTDSSIVVQGLAGNDTATLHGSNADETVSLWPGSGHLVGPNADYQIDFTEVETVEVESGGGSDTAYLYDSTGDDTYTADRRQDPAEANFVLADGREMTAYGFPTVHAFATEGGIDKAFFHGKPGEFDKFKGDLQAGYGLHRNLDDSFWYRAKWFDEVYAFGDTGETDYAELSDSPEGGETFYGNLPPSPGQAPESYLEGTQYRHSVTHFATVAAVHTAGLNDVACLYDSTGDDTYTADRSQDPAEANLLLANGQDITAYGFPTVHAFASEGGIDKAFFYGKPGEYDKFKGDLR